MSYKIDSNGELHPVPPPAFKGGIFMVLVQNNETEEVYLTRLKAFTVESDAQAYANSFTKHWIRTRIILVPIVS